LCFGYILRCVGGRVVRYTDGNRARIGEETHAYGGRGSAGGRGEVERGSGRQGRGGNERKDEGEYWWVGTLLGTAFS